MSPTFLVPYFSGAVNYKFPNNWLFVEEEVDYYKSLTTDQRIKYDFVEDDAKAILYNYNYVGLVYLIMLANSILPWLGDVTALEWLQIAIHVVISLLIISIYKQKNEKLLFLCLYSLNPLVIYFVTFPYYYFWQVLPAAALMPYLLNNKFRYRNLIFVMAIILAVGFLIRPAIILLIIVYFIYYFLQESKWKASVAFIIFVSLVSTFSAKKVGNTQTYWHTIFIGIGAYPNPYLKTLSDKEGFDFFYQKTGEVISNALPGGNMYYDDAIRTKYVETLKSEFFNLLLSKPWMLVRNGTLNFFQSFSVGYFVDLPLWMSYVSAAVGFIFCMLLLLKKQFLWILAIAASTLTFTPYYPPIQAYMFGSFILIIGACISILQYYKIFYQFSYAFKQRVLKG